MERKKQKKTYIEEKHIEHNVTSYAKKNTHKHAHACTHMLVHTHACAHTHTAHCIYFIKI